MFVGNFLQLLHHYFATNKRLLSTLTNFIQQFTSTNESFFPYLLQSQLKAAKQTHFTIINFPYTTKLQMKKTFWNNYLRVLKTSLINAVHVWKGS